VKLELKVQKEILELKVMLVLMVQMVPKELKVLRVKLEQMEQMVLKELKAIKVQLELELMEPKEQKVI
jgi:hypothetical protein